MPIRAADSSAVTDHAQFAMVGAFADLRCYLSPAQPSLQILRCISGHAHGLYRLSSHGFHLDVCMCMAIFVTAHQTSLSQVSIVEISVGMWCMLHVLCEGLQVLDVLRFGYLT